MNIKTKILFSILFIYSFIKTEEYVDYTGLVFEDLSLSHDEDTNKTYTKKSKSKINKISNFFYKLKIKFPDQIDNQDFCGYYKGKPLNFKNNIATIEEKSEINKFIIVITKEIKHKSEDNHIMHLERKNKKDCKFYYLTGIYDQDDKNIIDWKIEQEKIENLPLRIPDKSIIILMNPNFIENLEFKKIKKTKNNNLKKIITNLPDIILKRDIKNNELEEDSIASICAAIDANIVHRG